MKKKIILFLICMISIFTLASEQSVQALDVEYDFGVDLAFGRRVVSSPNTDDHFNVRAVDANPGTRYAAAASDDAFFYVDLGSVEKIGKVVIDWEAAYATEYQILVSNDAINWIEAAHVYNTEQTVDTIEFSHLLEAKFVRFQGIDRATGYGYSFFSFEVYGPVSLTAGATVLEVSSNENETALNKNFMVDLLANTRWASTVADNQFAVFDLGSSKVFDTVKIRWEVSFARIFNIYAHPSTTTIPTNDDAGWYKVTGSEVGLGEVDTLKIELDISSRFIKLELVQRETSESTKKTGRFPWESTFSIYSFELFKWNDILSVPIGNVMEFSKNSPAWPAMSNITLNEGGLLIAPHGYPISASGVVTDLNSMASGDIPGFESYGTYNPGVVYDEDREIYHMIYRSELPDNFNNYFGSKDQQGHMSTLSYASSTDGINFVRGDNNPVLWPTLSEENGGGTEDPRVFKIVNDPNRGGLTTYYITYTMYDNSTTRQGITYTHDFITFHKVGNIAPGYGNALKSGSFLADPEGNAVKINDPRPGKTGQVYMIYMKDGGYTRIGFTEDVINISPSDIIDLASSNFGSNNIEALLNGNESCMAITNIYGQDDDNIYLMYGGGRLSDSNIQNEQPNVNGWFYALGVLKASKSNPFELTNLDLDLDEPAMYPTDTNKIDYGLFNKCMFADSMIRHDNKWFLYYGAGDMYVGLATARGDFSAGAATFTRDGEDLMVSTYALNKKYGDDQSSYDIEFVINVYDFDGNLIYSSSSDYAIEHFSHLSMGSYSQGELISQTIHLDQIAGLPAQYYVSAYIKDAGSDDVINNLSVYTIISANVTHTPK
jgi:predicted GH43/DUF377 family glycosyl hydrolase